MSFNDKVVIVTGASSGIGASVAIAFSAEGAKVVMVGRNQAKLNTVAAQCRNTLVIVADMAKDEDVRRIVDQTIQTFGHLDILVNNAGLMTIGLLMEPETILESYDTVMNTNLRALVYMTSLSASHLAKSKGNIVNVSSASGYGTPIVSGMINYFISKSAVNHFTECAASELGPQGIRVNAVSPGPVQTDFVTNAKLEVDDEHLKSCNILKRISEPVEIADLVLFLASDKARGITGSNFVSDNGWLVKRS